MSKRPTVSDCSGCRNDFYNHNRMGLNESSGSPRCWSLDDAEFHRVREVHVDLRPPYKHLPLVKRPTCYSKQRFVMLKPEAITAEGYWK